jgi:hypothetical protein
MTRSAYLSNPLVFEATTKAVVRGRKDAEGHAAGRHSSR